MLARVEVFKGMSNKQWYWRLKGNNGEIMAQSEGYLTRWSAKRGARRFKKVANDADIRVFK